MKNFRLRLHNKIRLTYRNLRGEKIKTNGKTLLSKKTELSIFGDMSIGNGVVTERGVFLGVRKGAVLNIASKTYINRNTCIVARKAISIGKNVKIAPNVCIYDHDHSDKSADGYISSPITINDNVWIGSNCVILKGVTIGENSVIAAGSVITRDVPPNTTVYQKRESTIVANK